MIEAFHPFFASVAVAGALLLYLRELSGCGLNARIVRIPLLVVLVPAVGLARVAFGIERGLPWSQTARPAPGGYVLYGALPALALFTLWLRAHGIVSRPYVDRLAPYVLLALAPARSAAGSWAAVPGSHSTPGRPCLHRCWPPDGTRSSRSSFFDGTDSIPSAPHHWPSQGTPSAAHCSIRSAREV